MENTSICFHAQSNLRIKWAETKPIDSIRIAKPYVQCDNCHTILPNTEEPAVGMLNNITERQWRVKHKATRNLATPRLAY